MYIFLVFVQLILILHFQKVLEYFSSHKTFHFWNAIITFKKGWIDLLRFCFCLVNIIFAMLLKGFHRWVSQEIHCIIIIYFFIMGIKLIIRDQLRTPFSSLIHKSVCRTIFLALGLSSCLYCYELSFSHILYITT